MDDIAIGRKEIMKALHVIDWGTVRHWKRQHKLPVFYLPNGRPMIFKSAVLVWMESYFKHTKQK